MRLGLFQASSPAGDLPAGLAAVEAALSDAAAEGVDMLVMPELFLPGYNAVTTEPPEGWEDVPGRLAGMIRAQGVGLTIGLPDWTDAGLSNAAVAFSGSGDEIARYAKMQLFGPRERDLFTPGERHAVFDWKGTRFGLLICYDAEFPEHVRALARAGCEAILVPTANMMPFVNVNQILVPARAAENAVTIVYANCCGSEGDLDYVGLSAILGPEGYPLASKGRGPGLALADMPGDWREHDIPLSSQIADLRRVGPPDC